MLYFDLLNHDLINIIFNYSIDMSIEWFHVDYNIIDRFINLIDTKILNQVIYYNYRNIYELHKKSKKISLIDLFIIETKYVCTKCANISGIFIS